MALALLCEGVGQAGRATSSRQLTPTYRSAAACRQLYDTLTKNGPFGQIPGRPAFEVNPFQGAIQVAGAIIGVVDDDDGIRAALDGLLQSAGFRVVTFASATALLSSMHLHILACLILDLHMSGMDGLRLQRHLADAGYRIPIIVLTADGDSETRARAMNEGAVAFLSKPFDSDLLLAEVTRAVARTT